jgi:hypothetical protein
MTTTGLVLVIVLAVLIVGALAAVVRVPHRLASRKPLETQPEDLADPLPRSTARQQ